MKNTPIKPIKTIEYVLSMIRSGFPCPLVAQGSNYLCSACGFVSVNIGFTYIIWNFIRLCSLIYFPNYSLEMPLNCPMMKPTEDRGLTIVGTAWVASFGSTRLTPTYTCTASYIFLPRNYRLASGMPVPWEALIPFGKPVLPSAAS